MSSKEVVDFLFFFFYIFWPSEVMTILSFSLSFADKGGKPSNDWPCCVNTSISSEYNHRPGALMKRLI